MTDHGTPRGSMYNRWRLMLMRCEDPGHVGFKSYGGRGIGVCDRWHDFESFLADVGYPPAPGLTIDRIDNDGDYEPSNVRWATKREQRLNQRPRASYWKTLAPCGTESAYKRHRRHSEDPCDECRAAHAEDVKRRKLTYSQTCEHCGTEIRGGNLRSHIRRMHADVTA